MEEKLEQRWQGKVSTTLTRTTADQIWPLYEDFCSIHKWVEILDTSYHLEGSPAPGNPGCIRYCSGPAVLSKQVKERAWSHEKLLFVDPVERYFTYEINESNMGFDNYVATIQVLPGNHDNQSGCSIEWSFVSNPKKGWTLGNFVKLLQSCLDDVLKKMEESIHAA